VERKKYLIIFSIWGCRLLLESGDGRLAVQNLPRQDDNALTGGIPVVPGEPGSNLRRPNTP
jgi:hypothetical protein